MNFELQKFFIYPMDFFSVRLPNALLTWLLMGGVGKATTKNDYPALAEAQA